MIEFLWLDLTPRPAAEQMALDTAMVETAKADACTVLRVYRWSGDSVSFGANESALRAWDRALLERDGIACVRRPTGGRAVWHGEADLTYAWTGPARDPAEVRRIYRDLHERLAAAIARPGRAIALATADGGASLAPGACFDLPVGGEVMVDGRKAIGSAQRVFGHHLLQHGAIALHDRQSSLSNYRIAAPEPGPGAGDRGLGDAEGTARDIAAGWLSAGALDAPPELTSRIVLASVKHRSRYQDPAWTWRR
jgi:lipoate-protein ligase A